MSRAILIAGLLMAGGCGEILSSPGDEATGDAGAGDAGVDDEECVPTSGERLRRVVRQHDDGSTEELALVDVEMGLRCELEKGGDGVTRCVPDGLPYWYGRVVYRNPTCTEPIIEMTPGGDGATHVRAWAGSDGCSITYRYFELGSATSPDVVYALDDSGTCAGEIDGEAVYRAVASEVTIDRFAAVTERWIGSGRIQTQAIEGEDGSRLCRNGGPFFDRELGTRCAFREDESGTMRCMPEGPLIETYYTDGNCTAPVSAGKTWAVCPADFPFGVEMTLPETCTSFRFRARAVGEDLAAGFELSGTCQPIDPEVYRLVSAGDFVASTSLVRSTRQFTGGGDRLSRVTLVSDDGAEQFDGRWLDQTLGAMCRFREAGDGSERCVPHYTTDRPVLAVRHWFSDAACTSPLAIANDTICPGSEPPTLALGDHLAGETGRVWRIGAAYTGPAYQQTGAGCVEAGGGPHFLVGAELAPGEMVGGEVVTE